MHRTYTLTIILFSLLLAAGPAMAQKAVLDDFEDTEGWGFIRSDGVDLNLVVEQGYSGSAVRFDYDFTAGTGYGGIQKRFPIDLPENYEFTFYIKASSPANNFEIKFIDSTGNNVWWVNNRNYSFPDDWTRIRIKKRHIEFAWGPTEDHDLRRIDRIEFTVASYVGGKGTLWIDNLKFEPLQPERDAWPEPVITASSSMKGHKPGLMTDRDAGTYWQSKGTKDQHILVDFTVRREFGGLKIDWPEGRPATSFDVLLSEDGRSWEKACSVASNQGNSSFIRLPEAEAKYLKIDFPEGDPEQSHGIAEIEFPGITNSLTTNDFLIYTAKNSAAGDYPRYFLEQASYWTVSGVNYDTKEALINEDGMVEAEKASFSIEPLIKKGDSIYTWNNVIAGQSLGLKEGEEFRFLPSVTWKADDLELVIEVRSGGEANKNSVLSINYTLKNLSSDPADPDLYLLVRPFQVNPYYQWLNITGGAGKIRSISGSDREVHIDDKVLISKQEFTDFGASKFDNGNIVDLIRNNREPAGNSVEDPHGLADGFIRYRIHLEPGGSSVINILVPFHGGSSGDRKTVHNNELFSDHVKDDEFWQKKTDHVRFNLPPSADRIINTWKANLAYILINRDNDGIQPGSRSYERSWIRDGALTSSALLKSGIVKEVRDFIEWYAPYQFGNGKVPCVVDFRGPDPVPENDSHGELIYLIREYFNFTKDTAFLRSMNEYVLKAAEYIGHLTAQRSTDHFMNGNDSIRAYYGLVPESISHEGYSAKPMHSYWDNFFTMKGLKDAAEIERILGETEEYDRIRKQRDDFRENLYNSLRLAMKVRGIDYIPGCVELGDFDATSTTIALSPCNELNNLPKPQVYNTFDRYYEFFGARRDGRRDWVNYTPYENRLIGSFILLDQPERAHALIDFFLGDQRPQGWHHWAEVVWKESRRTGFIGDMPHTWVGSDFINAIRTMFVYENEYDSTLVLGAALYQDWIDTPGGMSLERLPTYYGELSYAIKKENNLYRIALYGDIDLPENGIRVRNFNGSKMPLKVVVNGEETTDYNEREIPVRIFPAELEIHY